MTDAKKLKIYAIIAPCAISLVGIFVSFGLSANRDNNKIYNQKIEQLEQKKVDKEQYKIDCEKTKCEIEETKKEIDAQNKLFLDINKNLGELNGKMDLLIKKKN